jgi:hypothetical protein
MRKSRLRWVILLGTLCTAAGGYLFLREFSSSPSHLYEKIDLGMDRKEVTSILEQAGFTRVSDRVTPVVDLCLRYDSLHHPEGICWWEVWEKENHIIDLTYTKNGFDPTQLILQSKSLSSLPQERGSGFWERVSNSLGL